MRHRHYYGGAIMTEQWTEWKNHTPGPCPVPVGVYVQVVLLGKDNIPEMSEGIAGDWAVSSWTMKDRFGPFHMVLRYRTRISPAFEQLRQLAEQPAEAVPA